MKHDNKPLTLEEMYKMEGEPVWVVSLSQKGEKTVHQDWFIVVIEDLRLTVKRPLEFGHYICGADTYGKTWLAYAQKPINFEKWICGICEVPTRWPEWSKAGYDYCPYCGAPLTYGARELLEKRLAGYNNEQ